MRSGGSTTIDKDGTVIAREAPTEDHPEGNKARPEGVPAPQAQQGDGAAPAPDEAATTENAGRRKRGGKE